MSSVGDAIEAGNARWSFGGDVAASFDQHVGKSIPLYHEGHQMVVSLADFFLRRGTVAYELGCSTGELTRHLGDANADRDVRIIGIETEAPMVRAAREKCRDLTQVEIIEADVFDFEYKPADLIVSYYTVQFIPPARRQALFDKLYAALQWGGGLILFEKVRAPDARFQDLMTSLYVDFKLKQGFSEHEIVHKTRSLKGVMEPFSTQGNIDLMRRAGFVDVMSVFKHHSFEGFLAIK